MTERGLWAATLSDLNQAQRHHRRQQSMAGHCAHQPAHWVPSGMLLASFVLVFFVVFFLGGVWFVCYFILYFIFLTAVVWLRLRPMNLVLSELQIRYLTADWKSQPFCFTDTSNTAIQTHLISPPPSLAPNLLLNKRPHHLPNHPNPKPGGRLLFLPPPPICSSQIANSNYCEGNMQFKDSV